MRFREFPAYLDISIGYRILTMIFSTAIYIAMSHFYGSTTGYVWIAMGMCISCLLSSYLYRIIGDNAAYLRIMFVLEVIAHSIFIYLSGGLYSPYLWYGIGCIMLMIVLEKYTWITAFASLWCIGWAFWGTTNVTEISYKELNICVGILLTLCGFYILRYYIKCIDRQKRMLAGLNVNIAREKQRSEYAYHQLQNLYETFNLFAITTPEKVIRELALLLTKAIAPNGCILIKFDIHGLMQYREISGIDPTDSETLLKEVHLIMTEGNFDDANSPQHYYMASGGGNYEAYFIGKALSHRGALIRSVPRERSQTEDFYWSLIDLIFQNLDIYSQTEQFITMEEQNRIANEIHDTVIQKLFGMVCSLKVFESRIREVGEEELREYIAGLKTSTELTMKELRESIYGRSFKSVNTFIDTMKLYMEEAQSLTNADISMNLDVAADYMSPTQKIAVYRVSCEAVNNALRHGRSEHIKILLKLTPEHILLHISDDGLGFARGHGNFIEGNGLKNMKNIAALLKGDLLMESEIGKGTKVKLCLPR